MNLTSAEWQPILDQLDLRPPASLSETTVLQHAFPRALPEDYLQFLQVSDGAIGHGPNLFIIIDQCGEVLELNRLSGIEISDPPMVIIGSDGCGNILAIDLHTSTSSEEKYIWLDSMELEPEAARLRTRSLFELLVALDRYYESLR